MKIVDKQHNKIPFERIGAGEVFKYKDCILMKLWDNTTGKNVVTMSSGQLKNIPDEKTLVEILNTELVVK